MFLIKIRINGHLIKLGNMPEMNNDIYHLWRRIALKSDLILMPFEVTIMQKKRHFVLSPTKHLF